MARLDWISQTRLAARSLGGDKNETMEARQKRLDKKCVLRMIKSLSIKHAVLYISSSSSTWVLPGRQRCSSPSVPESLPIPYWRTQDCEPDNLLKRKMKKTSSKMRKQTRWKLLDPDPWQVDKIVRSRDWELLRLKDFTFEKPTHPSKIVQKKEDTAKSGHLRWIQPLAKLISFTFLTFPYNFQQKYERRHLSPPYNPQCWTGWALGCCKHSPRKGT